jgi:Uma2 family endonuclease
MTQAIAPTRRYTPQDLLTMPDGNRYELVDGELVEQHVGTKSQWIGARLARFLGNYAEDRGMGWVITEGSYQCFPDDPGKVRRPDVTFVAAGRFPGNEPPEGHCTIVPDLAVEVVSPNDTYSEVEEKVREYLDVGVRLVWVIDPPTESVRVHRPDGSDAYRREGEQLSGEDVVAGFTCNVADLFTIQMGPAGA